MILNLGCGDRIIEGACNHDRFKHRPEVDVVHNLDIRPWPWENDSFDQIQLISIAEHLRLTLIETLDECWRILKPGGNLILKIPIYTAPTVRDDPTHFWSNWSDKVIDFVDPDTIYGTTTGFYTDRKWRIIDRGIIKGRNLKARMEPRK